MLTDGNVSQAEVIQNTGIDWAAMKTVTVSKSAFEFIDNPLSRPSVRHIFYGSDYEAEVPQHLIISVPNPSHYTSKRSFVLL